MKTYEGNLVANDMKVGIVVARFNEFITSKLLGGAMDGLLRHDVKEEDIHTKIVEELGIDDKKDPRYKKLRSQLRELSRCHWDMVPDYSYNGYELPFDVAEDNYNRLNKEEKDKDTEPMTCMISMLRMFDGLRIYRL